MGINAYLVIRMVLRDFGKVLQLFAIDIHRLRDEFPTDPRNILLSPGMKEAGEIDATRGGRSTELRVAFQQDGFRPMRPA